jgi:hypothetical protein
MGTQLQAGPAGLAGDGAKGWDDNAFLVSGMLIDEFSIWG